MTAPPGSSVFAPVREPACYLLSYGDNQLLNPRENVGQDDSTSLSLLHCLGNMRHDNMILLYLRSGLTAILMIFHCIVSHDYSISFLQIFVCSVGFSGRILHRGTEMQS